MGARVCLVAGVALLAWPIEARIADAYTQAPSDEWATEYEFVGAAEPPLLGPSEHDWREAAIVEQGEATWVVRVTVRKVLKGRAPAGSSGKVTYIIHSPTRFFGKYGYVKNRLYRFEGRWRRGPATGEVVRALRVEPHWLPLWTPNVTVAPAVALGCSLVIAVMLVLIWRFGRRRLHRFPESRDDPL